MPPYVLLAYDIIVKFILNKGKEYIIEIRIFLSIFSKPTATPKTARLWHASISWASTAPGQPNQFGRPNNPFIDPRQGPQGFPPSGQGPSKIDGYMQTANRLINTAQQYAPVVNQFAPMMRNLPAMWRLYKGFQSIPSSGEGLGSAAARGAASAASRAASGTAEAFTPPARPTSFCTKNLPTRPIIFEHTT